MNRNSYHTEKNKLVFEGSAEAYEYLQKLARSGELEKLLGVSILGLRKREIINLSKWLENTVQVGWQQVKELLTPQQLTLGKVWSNFCTEKAKLIDLKVDLITHQVILLVNVKRKSQSEIIVGLRVYPNGQDISFPPHLTLLVLDGDKEIFEEVTARSADRLIQCQFEASKGDRFSVLLALGEVRVIEDFIV